MAHVGIQVTIDEMIAEGDRVVCRNIWHWTDATSGAPMEFHGFVEWRFEGDKIAERWATWVTLRAPCPYNAIIRRQNEETHHADRRLEAVDKTMGWSIKTWRLPLWLEAGGETDSFWTLRHDSHPLTRSARQTDACALCDGRPRRVRLWMVTAHVTLADGCWHALGLLGCWHALVAVTLHTLFCYLADTPPGGSR